MNRTKFYNKVSVDGVEELDFLDNNLGKFTLNNVPSYVRTSSDDIRRPDLLSWRKLCNC